MDDAIPAGMKRWYGETANEGMECGPGPADHDGGYVLYRDGTIGPSDEDWSHGNQRDDIIAYTPAPSIVTGSDERAREVAAGWGGDPHAFASELRRIANQFGPGFRLPSTLRDAADEIDRLAALAASRPTDAKETLSQRQAREVMNPTSGGAAQTGSPAQSYGLATPKPPVDATQTFDLVWISAARPPVHPEPMAGRQTFTSFERAMRFMGNQPDDAQFVSLHSNLTRRYDRTADALAAIEADRNLTGDGAGV